MKRLYLTALLALAVSSSTGCCLFDRLFGCPRGYPIVPGPCANGCAPSGCSHAGGPGYGPMGGPSPSCNSCVTGPLQCPDGGPYSPYQGGMGAFAGCPGGCHGGCHGGYGGPGAGGYGGGAVDSGPPVGQVTYPYYTTRGPRDFFDPGPSTIGP